MQHRSGNHHHLDADRRKRQDQSSIGFTQLDGKAVGMAHHTNCRPKDNCKKPDKDSDQCDRVRDDFDQLAASCEKNRSRSQTDQQRKFTPGRVPSVFRLSSWLSLYQHAREHIEPAPVVQFSKRYSLDCGDMSPLSKRGHVRALQNFC